MISIFRCSRKMFIYQVISLCRQNVNKTFWIVVEASSNSVAFALFSSIITYYPDGCQSIEGFPKVHATVRQYPFRIWVTVYTGTIFSCRNSINFDIKFNKPFPNYLKRVLVTILSYGNFISFTCTLNSVSYEWLCIRPLFDRAAKGNSEIGDSLTF